MTSKALLKLAATSFIMGTTMVGCSPVGQSVRPANTSDMTLAKVAIKAAGQAAKAIASKDFARAVFAAETAVGATPRDAGYRMLLGQAYLGAGRFASAETAFADTLTLSPGHDRAALNLALTQIARGNNAAALATLADHRDRIPASDYGLALALTGDAAEAVRVLETAVRTPGADAKARQNLALAYAMAGDWRAALVMAQQDLSPTDAGARVLQWAEFARPDNGAQQVAMLLGVTPVVDGGQPTRLALAPAGESAVLATTAQTVMPPMQADEASPVPSVASVATPPAVFETAMVALAPVARPDPQPVRPIVLPASPVAVSQQGRIVENGRFVVQLGAFTNAARAERAWNTTAPRFGLTGYEPANGVVKAANAQLVRLSIGGFQTRADATRVCARIKSAGGSCFVRGTFGDQPAQWVQRRMPKLAAR